WPYAPPPDAVSPMLPYPSSDDVEESCETSGSIIECHNQVLGERIAVAGTPYTLNYRSDQTPGRARSPITIPVTGATIPASMRGASVTVDIAGRRYEAHFDAEPNQSYVFNWDGRDVYGRPVSGLQTAVVTISHHYPLVYMEALQDRISSWARASGSTQPLGSRNGQSVALRQRYTISVGAIDTRARGFGGWTLSAHHQYDPNNRTLYLGDGRRRSAAARSGQLEDVTVVDVVDGMDFGPDGSLYYTSAGDYGIFRL